MTDAGIPMFPVWLQAVSAAVQAMAAVLLYLATRRYIDFTRDIARANAAQLELVRASQTSARADAQRELAQRVKALRVQLIALPQPGNQSAADRLIRDAPLWSDADLDQVQRLASQMGTNTADLALKAVTNLKWLAQKANEVKAVSPEYGYDYSRFPWPKWHYHWNEADQALAALDAASPMS